MNVFLLGTTGFIGSAVAKYLTNLTTDTPAMPFTLPTLPFAPTVLEPLIGQQTMLLHLDKHHQAYITNLNKALGETALGVDLIVDAFGHLLGSWDYFIQKGVGGVVRIDGDRASAPFCVNEEAQSKDKVGNYNLSAVCG